MKAIWHTWQHGAYLTLAYGAGVLLAFILSAIPIAIIESLLQLARIQVDLTTLTLLLAPVWAVFGIGWAARRGSSEVFAPEGHTVEAQRELRRKKWLVPQGAIHLENE